MSSMAASKKSHAFFTESMAFLIALRFFRGVNLRISGLSEGVKLYFYKSWGLTVDRRFALVLSMARSRQQ